uniref:Uncharacterized protein n=1 Tax=Trichobilharzia regenti TaxID=157069 RepID=A0AA85IQM2_TRIRE|nr:unnamed protein product [Trichobilharzia regenti]
MHRRISTVDNPFREENIRCSTEQNMIYLSKKELRKFSNPHRRSEGGYPQLDGVKRNNSNSSRFDEDIKPVGSRVRCYSDDEYTLTPVDSQTKRRFSFSQMLLRKASSISRRFRYYMVHSVALFHEDLYGLSWSEAHDILQSSYNTSGEHGELYNHANLIKPRNKRHFSTSAIPNYYTPTNSVRSHSRLYHLDKPHYIQCKNAEGHSIEEELVAHSINSLTKSHSKQQNINNKTSVSESLKQSFNDVKLNDTCKPPVDELNPLVNESVHLSNMTSLTVNVDLPVDESIKNMINGTSSGTENNEELQGKLDKKQTILNSHNNKYSNLQELNILNFDRITLHNTEEDNQVQRKKCSQHLGHIKGWFVNFTERRNKISRESKGSVDEGFEGRRFEKPLSVGISSH